jgi:D-aminopeptidase
VVGTDAPLLPTQCSRMAQRAGLGIARVGGVGADSSGDLFVCFSTGNAAAGPEEPTSGAYALEALANERMTDLFVAVVDATEEAILNALLQAETISGRDGITAHGLPPERLREVMERYGRTAH